MKKKMKKNQNYKEEVFEYLLNIACSDDSILDEIEDSNEEVIFSKEHNEKMNELFKKVQIKYNVKKICQYAKRIAIILLVAIVIVGITTFSVEAYRVKFMNYITKFTSNYIKFSNEEDNQDDSSNIDTSVENVVFDYLPEGFKLIRSSKNKVITEIEFEKDNLFIRYDSSNTESNFEFDVENAQVEYTKINNIEYTIIEKDDMISIFWISGNKSNYIESNVEKEELIKVAENIKNM